MKGNQTCFLNSKIPAKFNTNPGIISSAESSVGELRISIDIVPR